MSRAGKNRPGAEKEQEKSPSYAKRDRPVEKEGREGGETECGSETIQAVRRRCPKSRGQAVPETAAEGALDAENTDRTHGCRDGESQDKSPDEKRRKKDPDHDLQGTGPGRVTVSFVLSMFWLPFVQRTEIWGQARGPAP